MLLTIASIGMTMLAVIQAFSASSLEDEVAEAVEAVAEEAEADAEADGMPREVVIEVAAIAAAEIAQHRRRVVTMVLPLHLRQRLQRPPCPQRLFRLLRLLTNRLRASLGLRPSSNG